ncbi:NAD(P)/FAD-dependent oxidoreductase [Aspergillus lucknowensis]|uniref:FAD/NAD(P)-binding domain-containing protein n=1 Tax=Aspergillus lucknowensis TaxID=176173 RepID=A0ABR4LHL1_9EURO
MPKTILILGASYAGTATAHYALKHTIPSLPDPSSFEVVLVAPSRHALCRPATPRALLSDDFFDQDKLFIDVEQQFKQYGERFRFVHGRATRLDTEGRVVSVELVKDAGEGEVTLEVAYHALIIATGSSTPSPLHGLNSSGRDELRAHWTAFRAALPSAKTIVIAGGGPAGIETAGELGEYLNGRAGWFSSKLENPKVKLTVVSREEKILPLLRPSIAQTAEGFLAKVGVDVIRGVSVDSVSPPDGGRGEGGSLTAKTEVKLSNGQTLAADLYIPAYGTIPNTGFVPEGLRAENGRVETNPQTLRVEKAGERVYAVGDASNYARPAVHLIMEVIPVLAANIKRDLLRAAGESPSGEDRVFKEDKREMQFVPIGRSKGVGAAMGFRVPSLLVWLIKGRDYFVSMAGKMWNGQHWAKET